MSHLLVQPRCAVSFFWSFFDAAPALNVGCNAGRMNKSRGASPPSALNASRTASRASEKRKQLEEAAVKLRQKIRVPELDAGTRAKLRELLDKVGRALAP